MVGGGQLARMTHQAAIALGQTLRVLAAAPDDPAALVEPRRRDRRPDDLDALRAPRRGRGRGHLRPRTRPRANCCARWSPRRRRPPRRRGAGARAGQARDAPALAGLGARHAASTPRSPTPRRRGLRRAASAGPWWSRRSAGGYDGRGVWLLDGPTPALVAQLLGHGDAADGRAGGGHAPRAGGAGGALAVRAGRGVAGRGDGSARRQCVEVLAPGARSWTRRPRRRAQQLALRIAADLGVVGLLAVELFDTDGTADGLVVNELAMRPHNSGHWTMDGSRPASSSSTCGPCWTTRSARTEPIAPVVVMATSQATAAPHRCSFDERLRPCAGPKVPRRERVQPVPAGASGGRRRGAGRRRQH